MARLFRILMFALVSTCCLGGSIVYLRVHRGVLEDRLKAPPATPKERMQKLRTLFEAAGCAPEQLSEQAVPKQDLPNVMCRLPGKEPGAIVVAAPIDFDSPGSQGPTQWATLALLPLLAESIGPVPHGLSLTFVAFTGHDHGLRGSSEYVKHLTDSQRNEIRAMVSLEGLGRTPPVYALAQGDRVLASWLELSANTLRLRSVPTEITARSVGAPLANGIPIFNPDDYLVDAKAFQRAHIPSISLRSAPISMIPSIRQAGAWPESVSGTALDLDVYEQTYNQLCVYLLYLDRNLGTTHASPPAIQVADASGKETGAPSQASGGGSGIATGTNHAAAGSPVAVNNLPPTPIAKMPSSRQEPGANTPALPVFRAEAQLVVIDVSVTNTQGIPLKGLQASDFTLLEDGKPQQVRVFEAHGSQEAREDQAPETSLPPRTFTNRTAATADAPLSILLFDLLNTPLQDQAYARSQMMQFLKAMPRGKHLALFVLGTSLQMVQTFTDDPQALLKAAEKVVRDASPLLTAEAQQQQDQGFTEEVGRHAQPSVPSGVPASQAAAIAAAVSDSKSFIGSGAQRIATTATQEGIRTDQRTTLTLDALRAIARAVSAYPGRKNLVWLSGSFQIRLRPSNNTFLGLAARTSQAASPVSDLSTTASYQDVIRSVTTAMATARIAVYPIDVRGVRLEGVDISVGTDQARGMVDPANNDAYNQTLASQSDSRFGERSSMTDLADQTGGQVFMNNDVRGAIATSLDQGSNYYTLAYTPEKKPDDSFRHLEIKLNRESLKLAYRPGYFPTRSQDALKQSGAHALAAAMQPGVPQSTMLLLTARVEPPDATSKALRIDYSIDFRGIDFTDTPENRKRALLDCMAVALDQHGQVAGQIANTMDAALPPDQYQALQNTGLPLHQELVLPPGTYDLRLGVLDRASQKVGTLEIPTTIPAETVPK